MAEEETTVGSYEVDWQMAKDVVEAYHRTSCAADTAQVQSGNEPSSWNPASYSLPETRNVNVDWDTCNVVAAAKADFDIEQYKENFETNAPDIIAEIQHRENDISRNRDRLRSKMADVQSFNTQSIANSDKWFEKEIAALQFVRDASAFTLVLGSTWVTGGASLALLGGGSALTGYGKYEDTGSAWAGVVAGAGSMAIGSFSVAGKAVNMGSTGKAMLILAKGTVDTATGLAAGDNLDKALLTGATTLLTDGVASKIFGMKGVKDFFRKIPMPVKISTAKGSGFLIQAGAERAEGFTTKSLGREMVRDGTKFGFRFEGKRIVKSGIDAANSNGIIYRPLAASTPLPTNMRTTMAFQPKPKAP